MFKFPSYIFSIQFASFLFLLNRQIRSSLDTAGTEAGCRLSWLAPATAAPRDFTCVTDLLVYKTKAR